MVQQVLDHTGVAATTGGNDGRVSVVTGLSVEVFSVFAEYKVHMVEIIIVGSLADGLVCVCVRGVKTRGY